jgi:hypothetical protein
MINNPAVHLFWHPVVIASVTGFHVINRYSPAGSNNRR